MRPRLAYVTSHPIQYQAPLFRALARRGHLDLRVFFASDQGLEAAHDPGFGRSIQWDVPLLGGYESEFVTNLARRPGTHHFLGLVNPGIHAALSRFRPDVAVVHGYGHLTEHLALWSCAVNRVPALMRGDSNLLTVRPRHVEAIKRLAAVPITRLLFGALSTGVENRRYYEHYGIPSDRIYFSPYAVDNDFFSSRRDETEARARAWRGELGIPPDATVVGFAAKLTPVKDCATLVEAFGRAAVPGSALVIVGDGPLRGELERHASRFPEAVVRFAGFANQQAMPAAYAMCDLFALPSTFEPWGLAINEAMCLGRPLVVSDQVGCAPDLVLHENGWVFRAGDAEGLAQILRRALRDRDALREMGAASSRIVRAWSLDASAAGIEDAVRRVLAAHPGPR